MTILLYDLVGSDRTRPFSPHCWKAALSLAHKSLDWQSVPWGVVSLTDTVGRAEDSEAARIARERGLLVDTD